MTVLQPNMKSQILTRLIWHSAQAQAIWLSRLSAIEVAWVEAERSSVLEGIRDAVQQPLSKSGYLMLLPWAMQNGLFVRVTRTTAAWNGFTHRYLPGDDYLVTVFARRKDCLEEPDQHFGYPSCCVQRFGLFFPLLTDPMWQFAGGKTGSPDDPAPKKTRVIIREETNPFLRYLNLRLCPHIPCGPACQGTIDLSKAMQLLMPDEPLSWARELLAQPVTWDSYRGIALVTTRDFRLVVGTDALKYRYIVEAGGCDHVDNLAGVDAGVLAAAPAGD